MPRLEKDEGKEKKKKERGKGAETKDRSARRKKKRKEKGGRQEEMDGTCERSWLCCRPKGRERRTREENEK